MPDATTLATGVAFVFNNNATGTLTLQDYATGSIGIITAGGAVELVLLANGTVAGTWDVHGFLPEAVTWGTNALNLGTTIITNGTWNGGTIPTAYGGTGLTTFTAANGALYSTSASALAAGTLPVAAGGTGATSATAYAVQCGGTTSTGAYQSIASVGTTGQVLTSNGAGALPTFQAAGGGFPAGTVLLFYQSAAPTSWTKLTTQNDKALRVVSGSGGVAGGTTAFSSVFTNQTVSTSVSVSGTTGNTTLSTAQMPSHTHTYPTGAIPCGPLYAGIQTWATVNQANTSSTGGGGSHNHSFSGSGSGTSSAVTLNVQYIDIILCSKD